MKRVVPILAVFAAAITLSAQTPRRAAVPPVPVPPFSVVEATIPEMRAAMERGRVTSRELVIQSLTRIAFYEEDLNAVMAVNPRALAEADARDRERRDGKVRGPLHGIPIALKDIIHTTDMPTTGAAAAGALGAWDMGRGTWGVGHGTWDMGHGAWDMGLGARVPHSEFWLPPAAANVVN